MWATPVGQAVTATSRGFPTPALAALAAGAKREAIPPFEVGIPKPDLRPWRDGNALPGVWSFSAAASGPHVAVVALTHGNEIAGAAVLDRWLRAGLRPARGRLSLVFANMEAFGRFDPADPTASRFVDEDMNRVWDEAVLAGEAGADQFLFTSRGDSGTGGQDSDARLCGYAVLPDARHGAGRTVLSVLRLVAQEHQAVGLGMLG